MAAAESPRVHRLLKIITLIQGGGGEITSLASRKGAKGGGGGWTPARLAAECNTNERSIFRDIKCIEAAGIPISFDRIRKTYSIAGDHYLPPTTLSMEESLAIMALADGISKDEQVPHLRAAHAAAQKVRSQLPASVRQYLEKAEGRVTIRLAAANPPGATTSVFEKVRDAIATRSVLDVAYDSSNAASSSTDDKPFKLRPYELVFDERAWYVLGHSSRRDAVRTYKLSRFTKVLTTTERFELPRAWSLEKHRGNAWRMIRGPIRHNIELRFSPRFGETVADTLWHKTQETEELDDGSIKFTCSVDGLDEIIWWILGMGPECKVISPPELVEKVKDLASKTAALYATPKPK